MIPVTKPYYPPKQNYQAWIDRIWENGWLTNDGPLVRQLEAELRQYLQIPSLLLTANGTLALQLLLRLFGQKGEVITTPFSYVATTSAILWEGCTPVFADIDAATWNIDPVSVARCITPRTRAILVTHVFGNAADTEALQSLADAHGIALLYDAAHCFGASYLGRSLLEYGHGSACSLHATKLYHSTEGGLVYTADPAFMKDIDLMRNFGHVGAEAFAALGINAKNSELHAAMGLANLPFVTELMAERRQLSDRYDELLAHLPLQKQLLAKGLQYNYAYYPVLFAEPGLALYCKDLLEKQGIGTRRYFHPMLHHLPFVETQQPLPVADDIEGRVLCLPMFNGLMPSQQCFIAGQLTRALQKAEIPVNE